MSYEDYLAHHGIKGMRWGEMHGPPYPLNQQAHNRVLREGNKPYVRPGTHDVGPNHNRYSKKRSLNPISNVSNSVSHVKKTLSEYGSAKVSDLNYRFKMLTKKGRDSVDRYLDAGVDLSRIQSNDTFEKFAFYATHNKHDQNEYAGLFGKNLKSRAQAAAREAERRAKKTGREEDIAEAKRLREEADGMNIHRLHISSNQRLNIPSTKNATDAAIHLMKDKEFRDDLKYSINDAATKMKRPSQQLLFNQAKRIVNKDPSRMSDSEKETLYKALNLSLTFHDEKQVRMQGKYYGELKKRGYSAIADLNDRDFSSYHAKDPVIVFDTDKVALQSVTKMDDKQIDKLYKRYNAERIIKESVEQTLGTLTKVGDYSISETRDNIRDAINDYTSSGSGSRRRNRNVAYSGG